MRKRKRTSAVGAVLRRAKIPATQRAKVVVERPKPFTRATKNLRTGGLIDREVKYHDFQVDNQALVAGIAGGESDPAANCLFYPLQGTTATTREGRRCLMKSIYINFIFSGDPQTDQADSPGPIPIMVAVVMDSQTNGAQLSAEDVYDDNATSKTLACRNMLNMGRFKVLWVKRFFLQPVVGMRDDAAGPPCTGSFSYNARRFTMRRTLNVPVNFVTNNGNVGDIADNSLHVIAWGTADVNLYYRGRVMFVG